MEVHAPELNAQVTLAQTRAVPPWPRLPVTRDTHFAQLTELGYYQERQPFHTLLSLKRKKETYLDIDIWVLQKVNSTVFGKLVPVSTNDWFYQ